MNFGHRKSMLIYQKLPKNHCPIGFTETIEFNSQILSTIKLVYFI